MRRKTRVQMLALVATATAAIAGWGTIEVAGQVQPPPVVTYNGCIAADDGTFYSFGPEAAVECKEGDSAASLSSGDVTEVAGGGGLTGGAKSGPATLEIATSYRLPQDCGQGDSVTYEGADWGCLAPLDPSAFAKSDQACPPGSVASGIDFLGNLVCVGQASGGGPATDWVGLVASVISLTRCFGCVNDVYVHNPNAEPTRTTIRAYDSEGADVPVFVPARGTPLCADVVVPAGGVRRCNVDAGAAAIFGSVHVHADRPVLPFGWKPPTVGESTWTLDWYPICPEHVGTCND